MVYICSNSLNQPSNYIYICISGKVHDLLLTQGGTMVAAEGLENV